jgi:hypothetical protein
MSPLFITLAPAIIALVTSLVVAYFAQFLKYRAEKRQETKEINLKYLNPLRLYLEENHFRIDEILKRVKAGGGRYELLTRVEAPAVSEQEAQWFNGEGCYLVSTCYFTACLFYYIQLVRNDLAYLRLRRKEDTELLNLMFGVSHAFLQNIGIFYATQPSMGIDMYLPEKGRLVSYREFSQLLQDPGKRVWFDRLLNFYIETGKGQNLERVEGAIQAIAALSKFLDLTIGGGASIQKRYKSEGVSL